MQVSESIKTGSYTWQPVVFNVPMTWLGTEVLLCSPPPFLLSQGVFMQSERNDGGFDRMLFCLSKLMILDNRSSLMSMARVRLSLISFSTKIAWLWETNSYLSVIIDGDRAFCVWFYFFFSPHFSSNITLCSMTPQCFVKSTSALNMWESKSSK